MFASTERREKNARLKLFFNWNESTLTNRLTIGAPSVTISWLWTVAQHSLLALTKTKSLVHFNSLFRPEGAHPRKTNWVFPAFPFNRSGCPSVAARAVFASRKLNHQRHDAQMLAGDFIKCKDLGWVCLQDKPKHFLVNTKTKLARGSIRLTPSRLPDAHRLNGAVEVFA